LTIGKISKGIAALPMGQKRHKLEGWLQSDLRPWFAGRILPVTEDIAECWGRIAGRAKQQGLVLSVVDGLTAATAIEHSLVIATRNQKHFAGLNVTVFNPWDDR
jgi:predicted nucleic acid-binding protein